MPVLKTKEDWVESIRIFLRDTLSTNWQIIENKGKARLGIRFEDGTRTYKYLPYRWERSNLANIQEFIKQVHFLHIEKKIPINEAFERVKTAQPKTTEPTRPSDPHLLLEAWKKYKDHKVPDKIKPSTWDKEYKGKFEWRLAEVTNAQSAKELLTALIKVRNQFGMIQKSGTVGRKRTVEAIQAFLAWGVAEDLLPEAFDPPANVDTYVGEKAQSQTAKEKAPTPTIDDADLEELLGSLRLDNPNSLKRRAAQEWDFCLRLCIAYGLRPCEASYKYLSVKGKDKPHVWCSYVKRTSKGSSEPRRLWNFDGKEAEWDLIKRLKQKDPLPNLIREKVIDGETVELEVAGDRYKNFLRENEVWLRLREEEPNLVSYAFRHSYCRKAHSSKYNFSVPVVSKMMGHSPQVHNDNYSHFVTDKIVEETIESAINRSK